MKLDYNIYAVVYLSQFVILSGVYLIFLLRRFPDKIAEYFARRFNGTKLKEVLARALSCGSLLLPIVVSTLIANCILVLSGRTQGDQLLEAFLNSTFRMTVCFIVIAGIFFSALSAFRFGSTLQKVLVSGVFCFCAALSFVVFSGNFSNSQSNFAVSELPSSSPVSENIRGFLYESAFSQVPIKLVKSEQINAHVDFDGIYLMEGLVNSMRPAEINTVVAHEVAHLFHGDPDMVACLIVLILGVCLFLTGAFFAFKRFSYKNYFSGNASASGFCAFLFVFLLCVPFAKVGWTQFRRVNEVKADEKAVEYLFYKQLPTKDFESALLKTNGNLAEPTFLTDLVLYDHPTTRERIANIRETEAMLLLKYGQDLRKE